MEQELRKFIIIFFLFISNSSFAALSDKEYFKEINKLAEAGKINELIETSKQFFKEYPESNLVADVRLILAENEANPQKAIEQFRVLVNKYSYFKKRDYVQYKICEILYLQSKWSGLKTEAQKGIELFEKSEYRIKFKFFLARALIHLEQFEAAKKVCIDITKTDHSYNNLSDALMLLSYANRNMYGISRSYLYSLNEIISGFKDSGNMPAALYLLGRYYQSKKDYNKAYSAYSDVIAGFPKSPEAEFSRKELSAIAQYNPSKTGYLPDREAIKKSDNIDIQPEIDMEENGDDKENAKSAIQYSISLGPFDNIKSAREIKNLINKDFQAVEIAEIKNGFFIYAGRFAGIDPALKMKIRLAEEFGINGSIVKIIKDAKKIYIYEE